MRCRDGTQTICVVCEAKPSKSVEIVQVRSSDNKESAVKSLQKAAEMETFQIDQVSITGTLLFSLNHSLKPELSVDIFADILESALKPLKSLPLTYNQDAQDIYNKIADKLKCTCCSSDPHVVISYFNSLDRLIKLYNEFKVFTK